MIGRRQQPYRNRAARRRRALRRVAILATIILLAISALLASAGYFDRDPYRVLSGGRGAVGVVYLSGDMGLRYGMGATNIAALERHGIAVLGVTSSALFVRHRDRAAVDRIVADAVRQGLRRLGTRRLVLVGQSYGGDILQTGLAALPPDLRHYVAGVVLVVPGETVFFRADPSTLGYRGTPDSLGPDTARRIDWTPLTCIYGREETDSLCPRLHLPNLHVVAMPGGHFLDHDDAGLARHVIAAVDRVAALPLPAKAD